MSRVSRASQVLRRALQLGVLCFVAYGALSGTWRNFKVAHNSARLVGLMEGDFWAKAYDLNERALSFWGEPFRASFDFLGLPSASTFFGLKSVDPILALGELGTTHRFTPSMLWALLLPGAVALLLGKFFCSHLCPMRLGFEIGQLIRGAFLRLHMPLPHLRSSWRFGGWVLAGGLVACILAGSAVWLLILPYLGVTGALFMAITGGAPAGLWIVPLGWLALDVLLAPGFFCHNVCPQGFLLENLGRLAPWRLVQTKKEACPATCHACEQACPYALSPRSETHAPACDNCGSCVSVCPKSKLGRRVVLPIVSALVVLLSSSVAFAHHNKGMPHYGYFENYPQVPTEESVVIQGKWEMGATLFNFQGYDRRTADTPNDVKIFVYLYDLTTDQSYTGGVDFEIRLGGEVVARFSRDTVDGEQVYESRETLPESGNYELIATLRDAGKPTRVALPFSVDIGKRSANWGLIAGISLPVLLLFGLALYGRTRKARMQRRKSQAAAIASGVVLALLPLRAAASEPGRVIHDGVPMFHYKSEGGGVVMVMGGIPPWLFLLGIALVVVVSFLLVEKLGSGGESQLRKNLIRHKRIYSLLQSRWLQAVPQLLAVLTFGGLIYAGLFGSQVRNIAPVAVWTLWWGGLIFAVAALGPVFCFACPWDGLANLASRLRVAAKVDTLSFGFTLPSWLANMWPAIGLFALLSWAELGLGATTSPRGTAYMGLGMAALAVAGALLFPKKAFCTHLCPVGRISGIYSNFSPLELRARNPRACRSCESEDCLNGNELGYPCPTGLSLKVLSTGSYCIGCTECIKSCKKRNVALNLRPLGADLHRTAKPRSDEAWLCLTLLALTLFHGFSMTTVWENWKPGSTSLLKAMKLAWGTPNWVNFSLGMLVAVGAPIALYWLSCKLAARFARGSGVSARTLFLEYSFSLLPVALFYHLAHNTMHILMEGGNIVSLASDPLGQGTDYFGTAFSHVGHLISPTAMWYLQVGLIVTGHVFGVVVAHRISRRVFSDAKLARLSLVPMTGAMVLLSVAGLSLMVLDMNMRMGRM